MAFSMQLTHLELTNYRKFKHYSIDFDSQMTVLVGENGSGKTSILSAACVALSAFVSQIAPSGQQAITQDDAHVCQYETDGMVDQQRQFPVTVSAKGIVGEADGSKVSWSRGLNSKNDKVSLVQSDEMANIAHDCADRIRFGAADLVLPVIVSYGTARLWGGNQISLSSRDTAFSRQDGYRGALDAGFDERQLLAWFYKMTAQDVQRAQSLKPMGENPLFAAVRSAVEQCFRLLSGHERVNVSYNLDINDLSVEYLDENDELHRMPLSYLSDGYRTTLSMFADIAYRMALLNPSLGKDVLETPGVVLIDEVDLHLHPLWQARILSDLRSVFPHVQFIVTTHAPRVISSVPAKHIRILGKEAAYAPEHESYGLGANDVLTGIMGADDRQLEVKDLFDKFAKLFDAEDFDGAEAVLNQLEEKTAPDNPDVAAARSALVFERL